MTGGGRPARILRHPALLCFFALLAAPTLVSAQIVGREWGFEANHRSARAGDGSGGVLSAMDNASASFTLTQQLRRGLLTYRASVGLAYTAQDRLGFAAGEDGLLIYPGRAGIELLIAPPDRLGAWISGELGRVVLDEPSGLLFVNRDAIEPRQLADGVVIGMTWQRTRLRASAVSLRLVDGALNGITETSNEPTGLGTTILIAEVGRTALVRQQNATFVTVATIDAPIRDGRSDSVSAGIVVDGPVHSRVSHRTTGYGAWTGTTNESESGFALLLDTRIDIATGIRWIEHPWLRALYAGGVDGSVPFPAAAGAPVSGVFAEPAADLVAAEVGGATEFLLGDGSGTVRPEIAFRVLGVPSGLPGPRTGLEPDGRFAGVEIHPGISVVPIGGVTLSAEAALLVGGAGPRNLLRFHGRVVL